MRAGRGQPEAGRLKPRLWACEREAEVYGFACLGLWGICRPAHNMDQAGPLGYWILEFPNHNVTSNQETFWAPFPALKLSCPMDFLSLRSAWETHSHPCSGVPPSPSICFPSRPPPPFCLHPPAPEAIGSLLTSGLLGVQIVFWWSAGCSKVTFPLCRRQHNAVDERAGSGVRRLQQEGKGGAGKLPGGSDPPRW